tara:strand:- start:193 stop:501 length:309 start_codon:yes stop_codon:yes gene_type:complete
MSSKPAEKSSNSSIWIAAFFALSPFFLSFSLSSSTTVSSGGAVATTGSSIDLYDIVASIVAFIMCVSILKGSDKSGGDNTQIFAVLMLILSVVNLIRGVDFF